MKLPRNFGKLSAKEQEDLLTKKLLQVHEEETEIRRMLGRVRGGNKIVIADKEERPDEIALKSA